MKGTSFLFQLVMLYGFFLIGNWIQDRFALIIPGSIIGMLLLLAMLFTGIMKSSWIEAGGSFLIRHLPLLFLPVTIGIMEYTGLFRGKGMLLVVIVFISTVLVMLLSGFTSHFLWKRTEKNNG